MFEDLREAFREAVENFKRELNRDAVPETVDRLLAGMRDEAAEAKARVKGLEEDLATTRRRAEAEAREEDTCRRREEMARKIGDDETAKVAGEYRERHAKRRAVLEEKAAALAKELELGRAEVEEMLVRIKEARDRRASLAASAGRTGARESIREGDDLFAELDRMAEKIADESRRGEAAAAFSEEGPHGGAWDDDDLRIRMDERPRPEPDVDARLEELKRRMGEEE